MEIVRVQAPKPEAKPTTPVTPAAVPAATVTPEKPAESTPEELAQRMKDMYAANGWGNPPEEASKPAKPSEAGTVTPPAPAEPVAVAPAAPATPAPVVASAPAEPTTQEIISQTANATAKAVADAMKPVATPATPAPEAFEMSPEDARDYARIQFLEQKNPAKYSGKSDEFLKYVKAHYAYQDKWQSENDGKTFDPDADEHADWYSANTPQIDADEVAKAGDDMRIEELYNARVKPELDAIKAEKVFEQKLPAIAASIGKQIVAMVDQVDVELGKLLRNDKGDVTLSQEAIDKLEAKDPIAKPVLDEVVRTNVEPLLLELEKAAIPELNVRINPNTNPIHARIDTHRISAEKKIANGPAEGRTRDGRQFISIPEFNQKAKALNGNKAALAALDRDYWTVDTKDISAEIVADAARIAKERIGNIDSLARKKYQPAATPAVPAVQPAASPQAPQAATANGKPQSPSMSSGSDVVTTPNSGGKPAKSLGEQAAEVMFR